MYTFSDISQHWEGTGCWKPSFWKTKTHLSYTVYIIAADVLVTQGCRASAVMVLTLFSWNILVSAVNWLINSLWTSDATWHHGSGSTLAQVMACCLTARSHTWTNVDYWSVRSIDIHMKAISLDIPQPSVTEISLKIIYLKFCSNLPGDNELSTCNIDKVYMMPDDAVA